MAGRLRIGVDMHTISGIQQGIRTHLLDLYAHAVEQAPDLDFYFLGASPDDLTAHGDQYRAANVYTAPMQSAGPLKRLLFQLPRLERELRLDLLHLQYIAPLRAQCKLAVTIHDVLFETYKEYFTFSFRLRSSLMMRRSSRVADVLLTVSEFSKHELTNLYHVSPDRIHVTPNAADTTRFHPGLSADPVLLRRGLTSGEYLLSVGRLEPRKNYPVLLKAYAQLESAPRLVIVGQRDFRFDEVFKLLEELHLDEKVTVLSDVGTEELPVLYRNAFCFVYASVAEGFGMPVMEAFASGTPVICCSSTALTEIATGGAYLVKPNNVLSLRDGLAAVIASAALRQELVAGGFTRAKLYRWETSAAVLLESFRNCLA